MILNLLDKLIRSRLSCLKLFSIRVKVIRASMLKRIITERIEAAATTAFEGRERKERKEEGWWLKDMLVDEIVEGDEVYLHISRYLIKDNLSFYDKSTMDQTFNSWMGTPSMDGAPDWWRNSSSMGGGLHQSGAPSIDIHLIHGWNHLIHGWNHLIHGWNHLIHGWVYPPLGCIIYILELRRRNCNTSIPLLIDIISVSPVILTLLLLQRWLNISKKLTKEWKMENIKYLYLPRSLDSAIRMPCPSKTNASTAALTLRHRVSYWSTGGPVKFICTPLIGFVSSTFQIRKCFFRTKRKTHTSITCVYLALLITDRTRNWRVI